DFEHWGLTICPDVDTVLYGLAGVNNPHTGWGRANETWAVLTEMERLGGEDWFRLGDKDLALHLLRNQWLKVGVNLTEVTDRLRRKLNVPSRILPMCNQPVRTLVHTDEGDLPFQDYFVRRRCEPTFRGLTFVGAAKATLTPDVAAALQAAAQIIICPSNPYLSVDPILSVPGLRQLVQDSDAPVVAVSPIVGGRAVKGPVAKMMREMGHLNHLPLTIVEHYTGLLDGFILDQQDQADQSRLPLPALTTDTIMTDLPSKQRLAAEVLQFGQSLMGS
ncbi:MAG: 2-phospho-L-lactate transferase CofD family protein, partial [Caldilineaceae bacterium]|nr:2-phospho-L-lactate transferase CofD family protein [Caldilineaceae bacterium]